MNKEEYKIPEWMLIFNKMIDEASKHAIKEKKELLIKAYNKNLARFN
jgi:hypothetical protein